MVLRPASGSLLEALRGVLGEQGLVRDAARLARYNTPLWGHAPGGAQVVLRPAHSAQTAECVRLCSQYGVGIVPFGGGTGFLGGQLAAQDGSEILLSLERMNSVRTIDAASQCIVVDAGMSVSAVRDHALQHGLTFPLRFGADATAQIGGALATNAGGMNALRYGVARDLCLGLEVVLASGETLNQLGTVRKDNTGYDLKQLFIGSEGTLGIITAASVKLFARPAAVACALVALPHAAAAVKLLHLLSARSNQRLCLFELMMHDAVMQAITLVPGCRSPFADTPPAMVLVEIEGTNEAQLRDILESVLTDGVATGLVLDAAVAMSEAQRLAFWRLREALPEANGRAGWVTSHDICLPIGKVPDYLTQLDAALAARSNRHRAMVFGHLGDGNLHVTIVGGSSTGEYPMALEAALSEAVLAPALALGGSVSAEHGIGSEKVALLARTEPPVALAMMRGLKNLLDPKGIMNPGKVLAQ